MFAELLPDRSLPYAQNCAEFVLFNGNRKKLLEFQGLMWRMDLEDVGSVLHGVAEMVTL